MVGSIRRTNKILQTSAQHKNNNIEKRPTKTEDIVDVGLVNNIIAELKNDDATVSPENVQKHIVYKTLTESLGPKASQEAKFKELFNFVNEALRDNEEAQLLIKKAIKLYK